FLNKFMRKKIMHQLLVNVRWPHPLIPLLGFPAFQRDRNDEERDDTTVFRQTSEVPWQLHLHSAFLDSFSQLLRSSCNDNYQFKTPFPELKAPASCIDYRLRDSWS